MPTIVTVGRGLADGVIEVRDRATGEREEVPVAEATARGLAALRAAPPAAPAGALGVGGAAEGERRGGARGGGRRPGPGRRPRVALVGPAGGPASLQGPTA